MSKHRMIYLSLTMILIVLLFPLSAFAQKAGGTFNNVLVESSVTTETKGKLDGLIYQALSKMEPNLANYAVEAETRILSEKENVVTCDTVATLRSLVSKQAFMFRLVGEYSLLER